MNNEPKWLEFFREKLKGQEKWLESYLRGHPEAPEIDLTALTPFSQRVLTALAAIPFGETRSYQQIAEAVGNKKAARAVGMACNRNPFPLIIPCHRVVSSSGTLGGYAFGVELKEAILGFEKKFQKRPKIRITNDFRSYSNLPFSWKPVT